MTQYATVTDLQARSFRTLSDQEVVAGGKLLDDALVLIQAAVPSAADRADTDPVFRALVVQIECAMVLRVVNNPTGVRSRSKGVDDFAESETIDSSRSTGELYVSDAEIARLSDGAGDPSGAFTIGQPPRFAYHPSWWVAPDRWEAP